jgi:hypothetical protein
VDAKSLEKLVVDEHVAPSEEVLDEIEVAGKREALPVQLRGYGRVAVDAVGVIPVIVVRFNRLLAMPLNGSRAGNRESRRSLRHGYSR